jgi:hypothetical protein
MKFIKYPFLLFILILTGTGCRKWMDINSSPANPQEVNPEVLLPPMQYQMANGTASDYGGYLFKYIQNCSNQNADAIWEKHGYEAAVDFSAVMWRMTYVNLGPNLEEMIKKADAQQKYIYAGIGMAMKAWSFQLLTDYHGPIILDEAYDQTKLHFTYQDQPEVYARVRQWAYKALEYFDRTDNKDDLNTLKGVTGDQIYKGDVTKWRKFIYSMLALQFSHLVNKTEKMAYMDSVIKYTEPNMTFANEGENPMVFFNGIIAADANPMGVLNSGNILNYTATTARITGRISQPILKLLTGGVRGTAVVDAGVASPTNDPRIKAMLTPCPDNIYRGVVPTFGDPATTKRIPHLLGSVAAPYPGKYIFADKALYPLMSYSQLQFARAEAYLIKGKTSEAYTAYLAGIDGHMDFINRYGLNGGSAGMNITPAQIAAYKASSEVAPNAASLTTADIMGQKYIAQWGWAGVEQWCDIRKYHYDPAVFRTFYVLTASELYPVNGGKFAYRVRPRYNSEYIWNKEELAKWGGLNNDYHTQETWFSKP